MKKICILISSLFLTSAPVFSATTYILDQDHTYAVWSVNHFGFSNVTGKFMAEGTLSFDAAHPENSSVHVVIHTDKFNTGIPKLDDILAGKNFFDSAEFPTATFKSKKVMITGKNTGKVYGTLTIKGVNKDVILNVNLVKSGMHPYFNKNAMGFSADTTLMRSDFSMSGYIPGVSDATQITINTEAIQNDSQ